MQENFLTYRNGLWIKIGLVTTVLLIASYVIYSQQTTPHVGRPQQPIGLAHFLDLRVLAQNPNLGIQ